MVPRLLLLVVFAVAAAGTAAAQHAPAPRAVPSTMPHARPAPDAPRAANPDSIYYDDGNATPDSFLGFGQPQPFHAALRFTTAGPFTLQGVRLAYRTEASTAPFTVRVFDASAGNANPTGGTLLFEGQATAPSPTGRMAAFGFGPGIPAFPAGASFFIVVSFQNVPFPMGTDTQGTGNYVGRSFFSDSGAPGAWTPLGDILGGGTPDVWVLRALGTGGGGAQPAITLTPVALAATVQAGASTTLPLTVGNTGQAPLTWTASAGVQAREAFADDPALRPMPLAAQADDRAALAARAQAGERVRIIARLAVPFTPEGLLATRDADAQRAAIADVREAVLARLGGAAAGVKAFETVPYVALEVDAAGFAALAADPAVLELHEDQWAAPTLAESTAIVGAPVAWNLGLGGAGQTVAVLDSGVETGHPFFGGRTVAEGCFSTTSAGVAQSFCPNGQTQQTGPGSGAACPAAIEGCDHGTHVAGITLGRGTSFSGVARDASLIALQVFTRVIDPAVCGGPAATPCIRTITSDQMLALEYVYALRNTHPVVAANMSLGGGQFGAACDADPRKAVIDNLRSARIATVVASGNEGFTSAISAPACVSTAVSVGSTQDGSGGTVVDAVSPFSNSAATLDLLAPGQWILSSVPGGGYNNSAGTSMAAPHVAGAWAVLRQQRPLATVAEVLTLLRDTGLPVTDPRNGLVRPRLRLGHAVQSGLPGWLSVAPASGTTAPGATSALTVTMNASGLAAGTHTGTVTVTSNDPNTPTRTVPVTLTVEATGPPAEVLTHIGPSHTQNTYTTQAGGFVHGTNGYGDLAKAVAFTLPGGAQSAQVASVNVYVSRRAAAPQLATYFVRLYNGTAQSGPQGPPLGQQAFTLAAALPGEPAGPTPHVFNQAIPVGGSFFVSVAFPPPYGNADFAIAASQALGAASPFEWEMWDNNQWHNMSTAWNNGANGWHMWLEAVLSGNVSAEDVAEAGRATLAPVYPNPVADAATVAFALPAAGDVRLEAFDALGRRVAVLAEGALPAGRHDVRWEASSLAGGVYVLRLTAGGEVTTRRAVVVR